MEVIDESTEDEMRKRKRQESQVASGEVDEEADTTSVTPPKKTVKVGGVITSPGFGFLRVPEEVQDEEIPEVDGNKETAILKKKHKLSAAEYLARAVKSKVDNRSAKANLNSMKTKFLIGKKKFASLQPECGVEQDFMIILKNNMQRDDISHASPTAGK